MDLICPKFVPLVLVQTTDRYGRTVGGPWVGDLDICEEMVRIGAAWAWWMIAYGAGSHTEATRSAWSTSNT